MQFAELAPRIRDGIKQGESLRIIDALRYLLRRKVPRRPRLKNWLIQPEKPKQAERPAWPNLGFKGKNPMLRGRSKRLFDWVEKKKRSQANHPEAQRRSAHAQLVAESRAKLDELVIAARDILPMEDLELYAKWNRDVLAGILAFNEEMILYQEVMRKYGSAMRGIQAEHDVRIKEWEVLLGTKWVILKNIEREVDAYIHDPTPTLRVPWQLLPADKNGFRLLDVWLRQQACHFGGNDDRIERINFARSLSPSCMYRGLGDFEGYIAFVFNWTESVLLERAETGNAAYVIHKNWMGLSRLSKTQLKSLPAQYLDVVIHNNPIQWQRMIRHHLYKGFRSLGNKTALPA